MDRHQRFLPTWAVLRYLPIYLFTKQCFFLNGLHYRSSTLAVIEKKGKSSTHFV